MTEYSKCHSILNDDGPDKAKVLSNTERDLIQSKLPENYRLISEILHRLTGLNSELRSILDRRPVPATGLVVVESKTTKKKKTRESFLPENLMKRLVVRTSWLHLRSDDLLTSTNP